MKRLARDEHSSLFVVSVGGRKKFLKFDQIHNNAKSLKFQQASGQCYKTFYCRN
jgi:hypothetical protein